MKKADRHSHWEQIYKTREFTEVSWYQTIPETSLEFIKYFNVPITAKIIDIGGGDSYFADHLLALGYQDITVLDISETAIHKAKNRLGDRAKQVKWIVTDVTSFTPTEKYDFWHDRATFHFLTTDEEIGQYLTIVQKSINSTGVVIIGTFSEKGPEKCSGIRIKQYSEASMTKLLDDFFQKIRCISVDHKTPFNTIQNFIFCSFQKKFS